MTAEDRADALQHQAAESGNAMEWAEAYQATAEAQGWTLEQATDPGLMVGWFANAMAADEQRRARDSREREAKLVTVPAEHLARVCDWVDSLPEWLRGNGRVWASNGRLVEHLASRGHGLPGRSKRGTGQPLPPF